MAALTSVTCKNKQCKKVFQARTVDVNRGWGKFCSKSCKAIEQENRTGQYKSYCSNKVNGLFNKQDNRAKNDIETDFSNEDPYGDELDWAYEESDYTNS